MIKNILLVGIGGGVGAVLRYTFYMLIRAGQFPLATFIVNVIGSLALGMLMAATINEPANNPTRLLLATGLCGGFTTFSAFAYENVSLFQSGKYETAFLYIFLSAAISILAAWLGFKIVHT